MSYFFIDSPGQPIAEQQQNLAANIVDKKSLMALLHTIMGRKGLRWSPGEDATQYLSYYYHMLGLIDTAWSAHRVEFNKNKFFICEYLPFKSSPRNHVDINFTRIYIHPTVYNQLSSTNETDEYKMALAFPIVVLLWIFAPDVIVCAKRAAAYTVCRAITILRNLRRDSYWHAGVGGYKPFDDSAFEVTVQHINMTVFTLDIRLPSNYNAFMLWQRHTVTKIITNSLSDRFCAIKIADMCIYLSPLFAKPFETLFEKKNAFSAYTPISFWCNDMDTNEAMKTLAPIVVEGGTLQRTYTSIKEYYESVKNKSIIYFAPPWILNFIANLLLTATTLGDTSMYYKTITHTLQELFNPYLRSEPLPPMSMTRKAPKQARNETTSWQTTKKTKRIDKQLRDQARK